MTKQAHLLHKLYYNAKTGFVGAQKLYEKAKSIDSSIRRKDVNDWYSSQVDTQQFQDQRKRFDHFHISSDNPDSWQIDLAFWEERVLLTAVNINSRVGYVDLLSNKQADTVLKALKRFVKLNKPRIITSDNGSEFMNQKVQSYFKQSNIEHFNNEPGEHTTMGKIERFNRTFKQRLLRASKRVTRRLVSDLVGNYNSTNHSAIGMTPNEAKGTVIQSEIDHNQELLRDITNFPLARLLSIDSSQSRLLKNQLNGLRYVYEVVGLGGYRIQIRSKNGHTLYKSPNDLKRVNLAVTNTDADPGQIFEAEEILKHKKLRNGKYKYLVNGKATRSLLGSRKITFD
ncbi:LOW QUALITY PROTEIN: Chromodomain containing hypothetical protein [Phytophthora palmivora]|uniref:Integrase catalytic domain-containing protein n=1 Tax=Phytophthora palmivora TaxID=4796 RepID=A0A2P4YNS2_9STRA|nr:LOW QUALITY PROTEIN: Chromodomain containing hypothetical protein [Phytophthora palmivora]